MVSHDFQYFLAAVIVGVAELDEFHMHHGCIVRGGDCIIKRMINLAELKVIAIVSLDLFDFILELRVLLDQKITKRITIRIW